MRVPSIVPAFAEPTPIRPDLRVLGDVIDPSEHEDVLTMLGEARDGLVHAQALGTRLEVSVDRHNVERGGVHEGLGHARRALLVALREKPLGDDTNLELARVHVSEPLTRAPAAEAPA